MLFVCRHFFKNRPCASNLMGRMGVAASYHTQTQTGGQGPGLLAVITAGDTADDFHGMNSRRQGLHGQGLKRVLVRPVGMNADHGRLLGRCSFHQCVDRNAGTDASSVRKADDDKVTIAAADLHATVDSHPSMDNIKRGKLCGRPQDVMLGQYRSFQPAPLQEFRKAIGIK